MARRNRPTLQTEKRELTWSLLAGDRGTATNLATLTCVRDPTTDIQCTPGTILRWVYVELNVAAETITNAKIFHWMLNKNPVASLAFTPTTYNQDSKSWIIKRGMEMLPKDVATVYKRIFAVAIPKKMRRMSEGDVLTLRAQATSTESINTCGFMIVQIEPA